MSVDAFFTRLNPLFVRVLRSPLHWPLSLGLMVITVTGHKTGRRFSFPVGYQLQGRDALVVMVSEARSKSWWRNYREAGPVEVLLRGNARSGTAHLIDPHSAEFRKHAEDTLRRIPGMGRAFKVRYDKARGLTDAQAEQLADEIAAVRIDLAPTASN
jgi:hypothetical protein